MFNNDDPNENNNMERRQNIPLQQNENVNPSQEFEDLLDLDFPLYDSIERINGKRQQNALNWDDFGGCQMPDFLSEGTSFNAYGAVPNQRPNTQTQIIQPPATSFVPNNYEYTAPDNWIHNKLKEQRIEPQPEENDSNIPNDKITEDNNEKEKTNGSAPEQEPAPEQEQEPAPEIEPEPALEIEPDPQLEPKFWNVVRKFETKCRPDLYKISHESNQSTKVQQNGFVTMAIRDPNAHAFIKPRGQITVSTQLEEDSKKATHKFARILKKQFVPNFKIKGSKTIDALATYELPFAIRFEEFIRENRRHISYEPELCFGLKYRVTEQNTVFSVFPNGRLSAVGPTPDKVRAAFKIIYPKLAKVQRERTELEISRMKKKRDKNNAKRGKSDEEKRDKPDRAQPDQAVMAEPEEPDRAQPDEADMAEPDEAVMAEPEEPDRAQPDQAVMAEPEEPDRAQPDEADMAEPDEAVMAEPEEPDRAQPDQAVMAEPEPDRAQPDEADMVEPCRVQPDQP